jgi:tryptophan synthase beta chain
MSLESTLHPRKGGFGRYGGRYVSELLVPALEELEEARRTIVRSASFKREFKAMLREWAGRPTPLTYAANFSRLCGLEVYLKREDLLHGGAHKTNNVVGQGLLAKRMGKKRIIAETGAGQHGVATAMIGARLGFETVVYMGARDVERQAPNVKRMQLCGATVIPVTTGSQTLKDAINDALRDWTANLENTHYLLGTVCGPDPFPKLVRDFHRVIGREAKQQYGDRVGGLPRAVIACVGGGSNAIGIFKAFQKDREVDLVGVEPGGHGLESGEHGATLSKGTVGLLHGARTSVMQDEFGQIMEPHSVAAGLDYPGVGPEHAYLRDIGRARYEWATDDEAIEAFETLARMEGIIPAFESAHAIAYAMKAVKLGHYEKGARVIINCSGRGDKDLDTYRKLYGHRIGGMNALAATDKGAHS